MFNQFLRMISGFVLVIGPKSAGKTSILRRIVTGTFSEQEPTLGFLEEHIAKVRVIEIGGQTQYQEYWDTIVEQKPSHIFFVIDITREQDLNELHKFITTKNTKKYDLTTKLTICSNKIDLVDKKHHYKLLDDKFSIIKCSAKTGEGMLDILEQIAKFRDDSPKKRNSMNSSTNKIEENIDDKKIKAIREKYESKF